MCCGAALTVLMVWANIQYKLSLYLDSRARPDKAGTCNAVSIDNVPSYFPYTVFGKEWVSEREKRCTYCVNSGVHEFSGTCEDMIPLTGTSCRTTCVGLSGSCQEASSDGVLVVEGTTHLQEMTLWWTPRRQGCF